MRENELLDAKKLYKFLKKKRALKAYIDNVMERHGDEDDVKKFYEKGDILGIIDLFHSSIYLSFAWSKTKEEFRFWYGLENEFWIFSTILAHDRK